MSISVNGQSSVPPGFRFHPTEEELLNYYLRKKVASEKIDLDVIREIVLNKLEPWEIQEKCKIGTTPQNDWYFFSHKDKKYPTGTRTNRATAAGFWKATGRDKVIQSSLKRIGKRKTLVFYTGRAPNGRKSNWIMHEYRLDELHFSPMAESLAQESTNKEEGWVVCRVFKKKNFLRESSHTSNCSSSNYMAITNDGSLDQIVQSVGRSCRQESGKNMGAAASRMPLYSERFMKLPALESYHQQVSTTAAVNYNCDYDAGVPPMNDWAALDKLIAFQLNGQFDEKQIMLLDDTVCFSTSMDSEEESSGKGDMWSWASSSSDRM